MWTYELPALKHRPEGIEPNLDFELERFSSQEGRKVRFTSEAKVDFLKFALSPEAIWSGNFRDLNAAVTRMATLAEGARIQVEDVKQEVQRLHQQWNASEDAFKSIHLDQFLTQDTIAKIDNFDKKQLQYVIEVCHKHSSLASAGRELFNISRLEKKVANDSSRLQKYLAKFNLKFQNLREDMIC
ncbi:MAG: hypothetical protein AAGB12_16205 [Pseudomonadota bacterium]